MRSAKLLSVLTLAAVAALPATARAQTDQFFASSPTVNVRFVGSFAAYTSNLYWCSSASAAGCSQLLLTPSNAIGDIATVSNVFALGEEVIFGLHVTNTGNWWFSGPASRNADNVGHFRATSTGDAGYPIRGGFEDLFGGGDQDYDDIMFDFQNVATTPLNPTTAPEPASVSLVALGLAGMLFAARRRVKG